ncbi:MAG TPA: DinB family protein [Thermoanaerobaculia bacterium]|jgi:uncharacterized damage-inducible protein DinB
MNVERLFEYDAWANREEVQHLRSLEKPPEKAVKILAHIIGTEWLFLGRLRRDPKPATVWPDLTLDQCAAQIEKLAAAWPAEFGRTDDVEYVNSKGEKWTSRADDILTHVILHGAYHRGQIATIVRGSGETPAYTDYIHCVRQGFID